jgi:phosphoglycolate phosphatase
MRFKAVVFDLDGTLVDSAPGLSVSLNRVLEEAGRRPLDLDAVKSMVGDGIRVLLERACAASGQPMTEQEADKAVARFRACYADDSIRHTSLNPGARDVLARFAEQGIAMGLCTNKPHGATLPLLAGLDLERYFGAVLGGDSVAGIRKPDPGHVLAVLDALDVLPDDAVMVGDSPNDVRAGRGAGLPVVAVTFGYPLGPIEALGADALIDHFDELTDVLGQL